MQTSVLLLLAACGAAVAGPRRSERSPEQHGEQHEAVFRDDDISMLLKALFNVESSSKNDEQNNSVLRDLKELESLSSAQPAKALSPNLQGLDILKGAEGLQEHDKPLGLVTMKVSDLYALSQDASNDESVKWDLEDKAIYGDLVDDMYEDDYDKEVGDGPQVVDNVGTVVDGAPRDDWWKCKVDNCRRNCNDQGKNGACVGPVCVCWR